MTQKDDVSQTMLQSEAEIHQSEILCSQSKEKLLHSRSQANEAKASLAAQRNKGSVSNGLAKLRDTGRVSGFHVRCKCH